jgi:hypothetical protein
MDDLDDGSGTDSNLAALSCLGGGSKDAIFTQKHAQHFHILQLRMVEKQ